MATIYSYRDERLYCHHSYDESINPDSFPMHAHERIEIYYCISGHGTYTVEGNVYPLEPGDLFIMQAAEIHRPVLNPETPYERISINFDAHLIKSIDPELRLLRPILNRPLGQFNRYNSALFPNDFWKTAFVDFDFTKSHHAYAHILSRLMILLPCLCDAFDRIHGEATVPAGPATELVSYINSHLYEDISLESVSKHFYMSTSQVNRLFRQTVGSSLWEYVLAKRLLAAKAMITEGKPAGSACLACGFNDYSAFYRAYKQRFGHPPRADAQRYKDKK